MTIRSRPGRLPSQQSRGIRAAKAIVVETDNVFSSLPRAVIEGDRFEAHPAQQRDKDGLAKCLLLNVAETGNLGL
jgi:hypothetical protein